MAIQQTTLLDLVSRPSPPERHEFLRTACFLSRSRKAAALLWLYDSSSQGDCYLLDRQIFISFSNNNTPRIETTDDPRLTGIFAHRKNTANGHSESDVDPKTNGKLKDWTEENGLVHTLALPLAKVRPMPDEEFVGFLQILTSDEISQEGNELLKYLAASLTQTIANRRETRLLELSKSLFRAIDDISSVDYVSCDQWFNYAARQLVLFTKAELCLVYSHNNRLQFTPTHGALKRPGDLDFKSLPLDPDCRIRQIATENRPIRLRRFLDENERMRVFGTPKYDATHLQSLKTILKDNINSLAACPVIVDNQTIAIIAVFNKTVHLANTFSKVDELALATVAKSLATSLPAARINSALDKLCSLQIDDALTAKIEAPTGIGSCSIFEWLSQHVPGVASLSLYRKPFGSRANGFRHLGGERLANVEPPPSSPFHVIQPLRIARGEQRFLHLYPLASDQSDSAVLCLSMRKAKLSPHEERILKHLVAEMGHLIRSEHISQMQLETLMQVRHVIRATLNGVGNIQPVLREYRRISESKDGDALLSSASFRKGLEKTEQFYVRTSVLLEEAKFLLEEISTSSLHLDRHSISDIVKDTCASMRCMAEYRGIEIRFHDKMHSDHRRVDLDRNLMQIALFNLVDNAIKYGYRDENVVVELESEDSNWIATVTDRGIHIPEEDREHIFQKFVRKTSGPHAAKRPGTGLGLAVAKSIIEAHGGSISVMSDIERKYPTVLAVTTFTVRLPRRITAPKAIK